MPDEETSEIEAGKRKRQPSSSGSEGEKDVHARSEGTADAPWDVRIMDSLARTLHYFPTHRERNWDGMENPVVTAVGFTDGGKLVVAHNKTDPEVQAKVEERMQVVGNVMRGERSVDDAARALASRAGLPLGVDAVQRITTDLEKLKKVYDGKLDEHEERGPAAQTLRANLQNTFNDPQNIEYQGLTRSVEGGVLHAELALMEVAQGRVGVSKLCCLSCIQHIESLGRRDDVRGTSGLEFNGWYNPQTEQVQRSAHNAPGVNQYPSDSESPGRTPSPTNPSAPHRADHPMGGTSSSSEQPRHRAGHVSAPGTGSSSKAEQPSLKKGRH